MRASRGGTERASDPVLRGQLLVGLLRGRVLGRGREALEGRRGRDRGLAQLRLERGRALERVLGRLLVVLERGLLERAVDDVEHDVALPQADAEGGEEDDDADDQPLAQLVEMLDEAETVLGADRPQGGGHAAAG